MAAILPPKHSSRTSLKPRHVPHPGPGLGPCNRRLHRSYWQPILCPGERLLWPGLRRQSSMGAIALLLDLRRLQPGVRLCTNHGWAGSRRPSEALLDWLGRWLQSSRIRRNRHLSQAKRAGTADTPLNIGQRADCGHVVTRSQPQPTGPKRLLESGPAPIAWAQQLAPPSPVRRPLLSPAC